jgi:GrpB-like predicted nucleotidyltransferase (UPF0157 family)
MEPALARITLVDYDPAWPEQFEHIAARLRAALGAAALAIEHVGSTAVPELAAKPVIDVNLAVADATQESAYAPLLEAAGFAFALREPEWFGHRLFKGRAPAVNLHVLPRDCPELERMRLFRDWLRRHPADRERYEYTKRALARQAWRSTQHYADAKTAVISEILARAARSTGG